MAEIIVPHTVVYEIDRPASVADVVSALLGAEQLLRETVPLLEGCIDGLAIERIQISVREISQQSPLRTALFAALVVVYQKDLEKAVPSIADKLFGVDVPEHYTTALTLAFCLLLLYGAEAIYNQVSKKAFSKRIREHMDSVSKELAGECGISEERVRTILEKNTGKVDSESWGIRH